MATGEVKNAAVEQQKPAADKPVKEKKPTEKKAKNAKTASHPPYFEMIKQALLALKEKNGSSPYAIAKQMEEKHKSVLPPNFRKMLALQLKNSAAKGKLIKIKASYKLSDFGKKPANTAAKPSTKKVAPAAKTTGIKRARSTKATGAAAGKATKKAAPSKPKQTKKVALAKPKQAKKVVGPAKPKSIKSPAAKKAKKSA